jgi:hypothetical protein
MSTDETFSPPFEVARNARKLLYMSRGLGLCAVGLWIFLLGTLQWLTSVYPSYKPYLMMVMIATSVGFVLSISWIERIKAMKDCRVQARRQSSIREEVLLYLGMTAGVFALVVIGLNTPSSFFEDKLMPALFTGLMGLAGLYFVFEGARLKLVELVLMGGLFWAMCAPMYIFDVATLNDKQLESGMQVFQVLFGILFFGIGSSLHVRWSAWRKQVLQS